MDKTEILAKIRKIEIKTKILSKHILSGEYSSAFKGRGMSFSEVRKYNYGDDIRNIDWNVTARSNETHIKVFDEEREMTLMLMIDVSKSSLFGSKEKPKNELIAEISALLAFSAVHNNDKVGAILFSDKVVKYIPPNRGRKNIMRIMMSLLEHEECNEATTTDINAALEFLGYTHKKRAIVVIISDFIGKYFDNNLTNIAAKHDLLGVHIYDRLERVIPNLGIIKIVDPETGNRKWLNTLFKKTRKNYTKAFDERIEDHRKLFGKTGASFISINTEEDYVKTFIKYFKSRR